LSARYETPVMMLLQWQRGAAEISHHDVIALARTEGRIIVTEDKDLVNWRVRLILER